MVLFIVGASMGLAVGLARGGSLRALRRLRIHRPLLGFGTLALLAIIRLGLVADAGALLAMALGAGVVTALANRHLAGMGVVAVGLLANLIPVVLDGGTPVEARAWRDSQPAHVVLAPTQHLADHRTSIPFLSSRIPLPSNAVVSFGDLIIAVGLAAIAANATRSRRAGIPVAEILASGPLTIDQFGSDQSTVPPEPLAIPSGWAAPDDALAGTPAAVGPRVSLSHPSLRLLHR